MIVGPQTSADLIGRRVYPTTPPRVEYWLTEFGATVMPAVEALADWGARFGRTTVPPGT